MKYALRPITLAICVTLLYATASAHANSLGFNTSFTFVSETTGTFEFEGTVLASCRLTLNGYFEDGWLEFTETTTIGLITEGSASSCGRGVNVLLLPRRALIKPDRWLPGEELPERIIGVSFRLPNVEVLVEIQGGSNEGDCLYSGTAEALTGLTLERPGPPVWTFAESGTWTIRPSVLRLSRRLRAFCDPEIVYQDRWRSAVRQMISFRR